MSSEASERPDAAPATTRPPFSLDVLANGIVAFIFSVTAPIALVLAAVAKGNLGEVEIASWLFGGFFLNSLVTLGFSLYYRQPLVFLFTMPGTVLTGQALAHWSFPEVVGAYLVTAVLILALGVSGLVGRAMRALPMPIVMGMVAGVFLQFGIDWLRAFGDAFAIAAAMTATYFLLLLLPRLADAVPPIIAALAVGIVAAIFTGDIRPGAGISLSLGLPQLVRPAFSWGAIAELVLPLAITVLAVQNGQGVTLLAATGHRPPVDRIATACGVASLVTTWVGAVSTCLTGPVTAILVSGVERERQYQSAVVLAVLAMAFGLLAPILARLSLAAPKALIATLAGLAMLKILQSAFTAAFQGKHAFGALISFIVTVANIPILNIGAPFWGLVLGALASYVFERED